ncbi:MAG: InlB B-repeat-containing protein [Chitinispirillia bacterium]|nr:InlB B-repeat-containing protein [Chitinispirillia bacterium]MCL2242143.1 InlB B-repeat-containing protein [Chitinispirillia bacterium]
MGRAKILGIRSGVSLALAAVLSAMVMFVVCGGDDDPTYTLTVISDPTAGGTVSPPEPQTGIAAGTAVNISATAATGYAFSNWTVSGSGTIASANSASTYVIVNGDATVTANFAVTYSLTVGASPVDGGTVSPPEPKTGITAGTAVNISATAATGYKFINWTVSGAGTIANANNVSASVTVNGDAAVTANFEPLPEYTLTVSVSGGGKVSRDPDQENYFAGTRVTVKATADDGYVFAGWTGASASANSTVTVTMDSDLTLTAVFEEIFGTFIDARDGKSYRTVKIGDQTWMRDNLNYAGGEGNMGLCFDNSPDNCDKYGRLYDWTTVMVLLSGCNNTICANRVQEEHQGICPSGWHVPSNSEWKALTDFVGGASDAGTKLKAVSGWGPGNGTDDYGFSALPGGHRFPDGAFHNKMYGEKGSWWSATEYDANGAWYRRMGSDSYSMEEIPDLKGFTFSVRCVR